MQSNFFIICHWYIVDQSKYVHFMVTSNEPVEIKDCDYTGTFVVDAASNYKDAKTKCEQFSDRFFKNNKSTHKVTAY